MYYNLHAIHICVVGDYDTHKMPEALQAALIDVLRQLQEKYGIADDKILFHRDCSSSSCPGRFVTKAKLHRWLAAETSKCPLSLSRQHQKVIGGKDELIYAMERKVDRFGSRVLGVLKNLLISCRHLA
ncbi:MAG: N-acetylmuramoyl-L-alanine amidase [Deltaproteobacteria bacterium]|nr:N-acetylmuramoyl-L-alanine amidase [Deltaproteobacteria bacterium]